MNGGRGQHHGLGGAGALLMLLRPGSTILLVLGLAALGWCSSLFNGSCPYDPVDHRHVCTSEGWSPAWDRAQRWEELRKNPSLRRQMPAVFADLPPGP